jgi:hypothetical protein
MGLPRSYRTLEEFEREEIRPSFRIGFSLDDIEDSGFEGELCFEEQDELKLDSYGEEASDEEEEDDEEDDEE